MGASSIIYARRRVPGRRNEIRHHRLQPPKKKRSLMHNAEIWGYAPVLALARRPRSTTIFSPAKYPSNYRIVCPHSGRVLYVTTVTMSSYAFPLHAHTSCVRNAFKAWLRPRNIDVLYVARCVVRASLTHGQSGIAYQCADLMENVSWVSWSMQ